MPLTTAQQIEYVAQVATAIYETIRDNPSPFGTPSGHIYAVLMAQGWRLDQYETLMSVMVDSGKVIKRGDCYFPAEKAKS